MRHLKTVSYVITGLGFLLMAAALLIDLDPTILLIGLMLIIAGGVKIGMVALWNGVAGFGTPVEPNVQVSAEPSKATRKGGRS